MELEGTITGGQLILDDGTQLPEGMRFRSIPTCIDLTKPNDPEPEPVAGWFMRDFGQFCGAINDSTLPTDLASQHEHYRLGTPKR